MCSRLVKKKKTVKIIEKNMRQYSTAVRTLDCCMYDNAN